MKRFVYLVQSKDAQLPDCYTQLEGEDSDVITLTWGADLPGCIYLPKSTWTEGRNRLLAEAVAPGKPDYLYYIFLDDDLLLRQGDWRELEAKLLAYEPAVATPYCLGCWWMLNTPGRDVQRCLDFDAMCNAFHRDVVRSRLVLPYYRGMDKESWWFSQWFVTELAHLLYPGRVLQINTVHVDNVHHGEYPKTEQLESVRGWFYGEVVRQWTHRWRRWLPHARLMDYKRRLRRRLWRKTQRFHEPSSRRSEGMYAVSEERKRRLFHLEANFWNWRD